MKKININFGGFYRSNHEYNIDNMIENYFDSEDYSNYDINYKVIFYQYSKMWLSNFNEWLQDNKYTKKDIRFGELISPKYYNYSTDVIMGSIADSDIKIISKQLRKDSGFINYLTDKTINKDGYISYYTFHDVWDNKDNILIDFCLDYLCGLFEDDFMSYYDRNYGYELLYSLNDFYTKGSQND